jgi:hypothetical protein
MTPTEIASGQGSGAQLGKQSEANSGLFEGRGMCYLIGVATRQPVDRLLDGIHGHIQLFALDATSGSVRNYVAGGLPIYPAISDNIAWKRNAVDER